MQEIGFQGLAKLDEKQFFKTLNSTRAHSLILVPELLRLLVHGVQHRLLSAEHLRFVAVGGGIVNAELLQQADSLGIPVLQGYGLSECASVVSLNTLNQNTIGSVGKPLNHVKVKIANDGEILVSGNIMTGYLGDEPHTQQWLATGDIGHLDKQGQLFITGRKKNLLVSSFGKNISPEWVESIFQQSPAIRQIMVSGEACTHLKAIIVPAPDTSNEQLASVIDNINQQLPEYAQLKSFQISTRPFLYENGLLTANGRLKRSAIAEHFAQSAAQTRSTTTMTFFQQLKQATQNQQDKLYSADVFAAVESGQFTVESYQYFLTQAYHHVKHTVPLLMLCGSSLASEYEWLRKAMVEYIEEEYGHEQWILNDIETIGGDRQQAIDSSADRNIQLMVSYLYDAINRRNPVALLGMVFMLEGTSTQVATSMAHKIQQLSSIPANAFSYLLSHGELDIEHFSFFETLVNQITDPDDQQIVIESAQTCFDLYTAMLQNIPGLGDHQEATQNEAA